MALFLLNDGQAGIVQADLRKIYPWPDLTFSAVAGSIPLLNVMVTSPPTPSPVALLIGTLTSSAATVAVTGSLSDRPIKIGASAPVPLSAMGGVTYPDRYPSPNVINVLYDNEAGAGCKGRGRFAEGTTAGSKVDAPTDVVLFHELVHVFHFLTNGFSGDPAVTGEIDVLPLENTYRTSRSPALGERAGHGGGCNMGPPSSTSPSTGGGKSQGKSGGCFIATAVLQTRYEARLDELRAFRDDVVYAQAGGSAFMERFYASYARIGPRIASEIGREPGRRRQVLAFAVIPVISYLTLAVRSPAHLPPVHRIPDAWRAFFAELGTGLQDWALAAMAPAFPCDDDEAAFIGRYVLRTSAARSAYRSSRSAGRPTPPFEHALQQARDHRAAPVDLLRIDASGMQGGLANWISAACLAFGPRALAELEPVRQQFDAEDAGDVFRSAFEAPLASFLRLCCAMPLDDLPPSFPQPWRSTIATFREDVDALVEAAFELMDDGTRNQSGEQ